MNVLQLNHIAIYVKDVEQSVRFYNEVIGLSTIPRPSFSYPGAWFRLGKEQELHLIGIRSVELSIHKSNHFALRVADIAMAEEKLKQLNISYRFVSRVDGVIQLFIQDPDGYFLEINNAFP